MSESTKSRSHRSLLLKDASELMEQKISPCNLSNFAGVHRSAQYSFGSFGAQAEILV